METTDGFRIVGDLSDGNGNNVYTVEFDGCTWTCECEEGMFLAAELPPQIAPTSWHKNKLEKVERIISVKGHFGTFTGENALRDYELRSSFAHEIFGQIYEACEAVGVFRHSGWELENFVLHGWSMLQHKEVVIQVDDLELERAMASDIVKNLLYTLNDSLYNQRLTGTGRERLALQQLASLIVSLRGHQSGQSPEWRPIEL